MLRGLLKNINNINKDITNINSYINNQFITNIVTLTDYKETCSFDITPMLDSESTMRKSMMYEFSGKVAIPRGYDVFSINTIDITGGTFETVGYWVGDNILNVFACFMIRYAENYKPDITYFDDIQVQVIYKKKNFIIITGIIYSPSIKY